MFNIILRAFEDPSDAPWSSVGILEFVDAAFGSIQTDSMTSKDHVTNGVRVGVWPMRIDELAVVGALFLDENTGNLAKGQEACGKILRVRFHGRGQGC